MDEQKKNEVANIVGEYEKNKNGIVEGVKKQITSQYEQQQNELGENAEFKKVTQEVVNRAAMASLTEDMLKVLTQEHKNELGKHFLLIEKQRLNFRQKHEKKVILQEIKAEISTRKIEALRKRFGYLYKENETFVASKMINLQKEWAEWWNGTSTNFRKFVTGAIKFAGWGLIGFAAIYAMYYIMIWVGQNAQAIPNL